MVKKENIIVTGAGKGIGKSIAKRLIQDGYFVIIVDVDEACGKKTVEELSHDHAAYFNCDIGNEQDVRTLFASIQSRFGSLYGLVNNAAIIKDNVIWKMPAEDFDEVIRVNLKGAWLMCREAAILMREQKQGRIVNITSRGWLGNFGQTNYGASKGGMVSLTRVLALELGKYNVLVNAVAPGLIDTPMVEGLTDEARNQLIQAQPTKSMGQPEDVANAVAFLVAEGTQFITGQTIYVDGGKSIGAGL